VGQGAVDNDGKYWAFISYSHKDAAFGRRLHRRLEGYALPRRLAGRSSNLPRRLTPIFRDREELPAAQDLSAEVRAALAQSRALIVVCSPAAAISPWVAREIELFRALHPGRPILAALREGEPKDALPPLLRLKTEAGEDIEPLAADFRTGRDGWQLGLLKIVAGLLGLGLDELVRRDSQRQLRRVTAITVTAILAMLVMTVLTAIALNARDEAERQRREALGLVKFMHTDLRKELSGLGRVDLLGAVNTQALQYFNSQSGLLPPEMAAQRAQILQAIGEDDESHADRQGEARALFREAWATTNTQLAEMPYNVDRIFNHAQSEYWLGFDDYSRGNYAAARERFETYRQLALRMIAVAPNDPRYRRELSFAEGNLCAVALKPPKDAALALKLCLAALAHMYEAANGKPKPTGIAVDLSDKESWVGTAYYANGDNAHALEHFLIQGRMLDALMQSDPWNTERRSEWIALQRSLVRIAVAQGHADVARERLEKALKLLDEMIQMDPANSDWTYKRKKIETELSNLNR
jgi:tetratricopeptide (TPR) repeat protein